MMGRAKERKKAEWMFCRSICIVTLILLRIYILPVLVPIRERERVESSMCICVEAAVGSLISNKLWSALFHLPSRISYFFFFVLPLYILYCARWKCQREEKLCQMGKKCDTVDGTLCMSCMSVRLCGRVHVILWTEVLAFENFPLDGPCLASIIAVSLQDNDWPRIHS